MRKILIFASMFAAILVIAPLSALAGSCDYVSIDLKASSTSSDVGLYDDNSEEGNTVTVTKAKLISVLGYDPIFKTLPDSYTFTASVAPVGGDPDGPFEGGLDDPTDWAHLSEIIPIAYANVVMIYGIVDSYRSGYMLSLIHI